MPRAWERLEKLMKWEYKRRYGRMPNEEELKRIKGEPYVSEMIRRSMERVGATIREVGSDGGGSRWMRKLVKGFWRLMEDKDVNEFVLQAVREYFRQKSYIEANLQASIT
jgi:hypothetical protein